MESRSGRSLTFGIVMTIATPMLGCRTHAGGPPIEQPTAAVDADAGLPPPPLPARRGVIVPSDVGAGTGPSPGGKDPVPAPGDTAAPTP